MLEQYYRINQAIGIGIYIGSDSDLTIHACELSVEKNKLSFDKKIIYLGELENLKKHFQIRFTALNLSGKGILQKQTALIETIDQQSFDAVFPNANLDDFYIQNFKTGNSSFISIVRKKEADKWLATLEGFGYQALTLSLGPFPVQCIMPQLNIYDSRIVFDGNIIERNESGDWLSLTYDPQSKAAFPIKAESEPLSEQLLLAYAASFQLILADKLEPVHADIPGLQQKWERVITTKRLKLYGGIIIVAVFILLLVNMIVFSGLSRSNEQLADKVSNTAQSSTDIQKLDEQVRQKVELLDQLGWDGGVNKTLLIDQIAALLPANVTLYEILINPIDITKSRVQEVLTFNKRQIKVGGECVNIIPVNEWIARIKTKSWVKDIQLESYTFNNEKNTGQFTINIQY